MLCVCVPVPPLRKEYIFSQFSSVHFSPVLLHKFLPVSSEPSTEVTDGYATLRTPARFFRVYTFPHQN